MFIKQVRVGDKGLKMSGLDFKRWCIQFLCNYLQKFYYSVNPNNQNFVEDLDTFQSYAWGINVHEELLLELAVWKGCMYEEASAKSEGATKLKNGVHGGCCLILHFLIVKHIPTSRTGLIAVTSPRMLKWPVIPRHKTLVNIQGMVFGASK